jgi:hypothetical protein
MDEPLEHSSRVSGFIVVGTGARWESLTIPDAAIVRAGGKIVKLENRHNGGIFVMNNLTSVIKTVTKFCF